jgi:hypothetical protein
VIRMHATSEITCQEEFAPCASLRGRYAAGVVRQVESLRGRMGESERQIEGLFESLLAESFGE